MRSLTGPIVALLVVFSATGCKNSGKDSDDPDAGLTCADCTGSELCVENIDEDEPDAGFFSCEPVPVECEAGLDCDDNSCLVVAYESCGVGFEASMCDAEEAPQITCFAEGAEPPAE